MSETISITIDSDGKPIFTATPSSTVGSPVLSDRRSSEEKEKKKSKSRSGSKKRSSSQKKKTTTTTTTKTSQKTAKKKEAKDVTKEKDREVGFFWNINQPSIYPYALFYISL